MRREAVGPQAQKAEAQPAASHGQRGLERYFKKVITDTVAHLAQPLNCPVLELMIALLEADFAAKVDLDLAADIEVLLPATREATYPVIFSLLMLNSCGTVTCYGGRGEPWLTSRLH